MCILAMVPEGILTRCNTDDPQLIPRRQGGEPRRTRAKVSSNTVFPEVKNGYRKILVSISHSPHGASYNSPGARACGSELSSDVLFFASNSEIL